MKGLEVRWPERQMKGRSGLIAADLNQGCD